MISSSPANDLAVDVKVEHAAVVSCANTQLTALGKTGVFWRKTRTVKIVRNPVMARLKGTSGNSKGEHFFDLLSDRPWVRIPPGSPKSPLLKRKAANSSLLTKTGAFLFFEALLLTDSGGLFAGCQHFCRISNGAPLYWISQLQTLADDSAKKCRSFENPSFDLSLTCESL